MKSIVMTEGDKISYWHPFLCQWETKPVRILPEFAEKYFDEVIAKFPEKQIDLTESP